jgi:hypothetical protein
MACPLLTQTGTPRGTANEGHCALRSGYQARPRPTAHRAPHRPYRSRHQSLPGNLAVCYLDCHATFIWESGPPTSMGGKPMRIRCGTAFRILMTVSSVVALTVFSYPTAADSILIAGLRPSLPSPSTPLVLIVCSDEQRRSCYNDCQATGVNGQYGTMARTLKARAECRTRCQQRCGGLTGPHRPYD